MSRRAPDPVHPLQDRVTPFGDLIATPARGIMYGNRGGRFHDPATRTLGGRRWASKAWLICNLHREGVRRDVWGTRSYTELFFLDEVTALAAGHRPCAFCRRPAVRAYLEALARSNPSLATPRTCPALDTRLQAERLDGRDKRHHLAKGADLPDGAVVVIEGEAFALRDGRRFRWSPGGWSDSGPAPRGRVEMLTPPTSIAALAGGYRPVWHPSAEPSAAARAT